MDCWTSAWSDSLCFVAYRIWVMFFTCFWGCTWLSFEVMFFLSFFLLQALAIICSETLPDGHWTLVFLERNRQRTNNCLRPFQECWREWVLWKGFSDIGGDMYHRDLKLIQVFSLRWPIGRRAAFTACTKRESCLSWKRALHQFQYYCPFIRIKYISL